MAHYVVVGGGQAGASLVARLRTNGFDGQITLLGAEPVPPYQRPPLSKGYLLGEMSKERLFLRPASFYDEHEITLRTGARVDRIDLSSRSVHLGSETIPYDALALTTGSVPRRLPTAIGGDLKGVHVVRTLADVDAMAEAFAPGKRLLIVGGGYIGLEAAAVAAKRGAEVILVEAADRILQRVAAPETSDYFRDLHHIHGVEILENASLARLNGDGRVSNAVLGDGTELPVDAVIVGVGILPDTALAEAASLSIDNGIAVDSHGRTSDPHIWAAGDCASFPHGGGRIRLESVGNAIDMGEHVAEAMMGSDADYIAKPWFWSDQYDTKLQIAGLNTGYDRVISRQGDGDTVSHWYYRGDTLLALDAMNDPRAYMVGKRLIEAGKSPAAESVANPATDLKALLKA